MGSILFKLGENDLIVGSEIHKADFVMFDGRVIASENQITDDHLLCQREKNDSSKLRVLCEVDGRPVVLETTSLRESQRTYDLEREIARGELSRLRNTYAFWTGAGLKSTPELDETFLKAQDLFRQSVFGTGGPNAAIESIRLSHRAIRKLLAVYTNQRIAFRRQRTSHIPMNIGCRLAATPTEPNSFLSAFNAVLVRTRWNVIEPEDGAYRWEAIDPIVDWATENNMFIVGGPLLDLSSECFPPWMDAWRGSLKNLQNFTVDFVETVVSRYVGRIRHWEVVCGLNRGGSNGLSEEHRLNLVASAIHAARQVDEQIQIGVRVIQPWGEYLSTTDNRLAPIQFVDTLRRSGVEISDVNLDIRFGHDHLHSQPRDMLSFSQLIDHWSLLQIPINVMAALPETNIGIVDLPDLLRWQTETIEELALMCLSKERVSGFFCLNWADSTVTDSTLVGKENTLHPIVNVLKRFQQPQD